MTLRPPSRYGTHQPLQNGVNPIGQPHLPGVPFESDPIPWYFLILAIGLVSLWAINRLRDSRLGRAWMAVPNLVTVLLRW